MAPQRKNAEENGTPKEKSSTTGAGVTKKKLAGSSLKDVTNASAANEAGAGSNGHQGLQNSETIDFNEMPRRSLHAYRVAYNLHQPSSFKSFQNGIILSNPGSVGLQSPTMLRPKEKRRVLKRSLAKAVRNHFMDQSVNELDVEARVMYNVKSIDKAFRMKFPPNGTSKK